MTSYVSTAHAVREVLARLESRVKTENAIQERVEALRQCAGPDGPRNGCTIIPGGAQQYGIALCKRRQEYRKAWEDQKPSDLLTDLFATYLTLHAALEKDEVAERKQALNHQSNGEAP